jgi:hypothetical protein
MKRQDEQGHCDISKYLLSVYLYDCIYIYLSLCCEFVFLSLFLGIMSLSSRPNRPDNNDTLNSC